MTTKTKKSDYVRGHGDPDPDAAAFLRVDASPWEAAGDRGPDATGSERGANSADSAGLRNKLPDEAVNDASSIAADVFGYANPADLTLAGGRSVGQVKRRGR